MRVAVSDHWRGSAGRGRRENLCHHPIVAIEDLGSCASERIGHFGQIAATVVGVAHADILVVALLFLEPVERIVRALRRRHQFARWTAHILFDHVADIVEGEVDGVAGAVAQIGHPVRRVIVVFHRRPIGGGHAGELACVVVLVPRGFGHASAVLDRA